MENDTSASLTLDKLLVLISKLHEALEEMRDTIAISEFGEEMISGLLDHVILALAQIDIRLEQLNEPNSYLAVVSRLSEILAANIEMVIQKTDTVSNEENAIFDMILSHYMTPDGEHFINGEDVGRSLKIDYHQNGNPKAIYSYIVADGEQFYDGLYTSWCQDGNLEFVGFHIKGKPSGVWKVYDNDKVSIRNYSEDIVEEKIKDEGASTAVVAIAGSLAVAAIVGIINSHKANQVLEVNHEESIELPKGM